jgi:hypothetical protein
MIGCNSGYFRRFPLNDEAHTLHRLVVEICQNGRCVNDTIVPQTKNGMGNGGRIANDQVEVMVFTVSSGYWLSVGYYENATLHDGDRYDVIARDQDGRQLLASHETVTYVSFQPNGPHCPPTCMTARPQPKP